MKRIAYVWLVGVMFVGILVTSSGAQSQPLGDYARAARKEKKPASAKQFDNDNLPKTDKLSVVGNAAPESAENSAAPATDGEATAEPQAQNGESKTDASAKPAEGAPGESAEARQLMYADWKKKISAQKDTVDLLTREMDVAQREYRLRAAAFYADAGNRLRNSGQWDKEDSQYKQQIAQKQKALDAGKKQLEDLQEQARKAGVPSSVRQ
jgi:hypothetical protein